MPNLNRSTRKPKISILLTIDETGNNGEIEALDFLDTNDNDSYDTKRRIGQQLMKNLVRAGDVDRKPNFHNSDESGCQKQMNNKYDELMAALNGIVDRALKNDNAKAAPTSVQYDIDENTSPISIVSDETTTDSNAAEESLYKYIESIQGQLNKLVLDSNIENEKSQPVKRFSQHTVQHQDFDKIAREILKGIGLHTDNHNNFDRSNDNEFEILQKNPIGLMSSEYNYDDCDDIDSPAEMSHFAPHSARNLTKRGSIWTRDYSSKLIDSLRKRIQSQREPIDYCGSCHRRLHRRIRRSKGSKNNKSSKTTTEAAPTTELDAYDKTTTDEYLLHSVNSYSIDSDDDNHTEAATGTIDGPEKTTKSNDSPSTLEMSVTGSASEPSVAKQTPKTEKNPEVGITDARTDTLTINKNGIQVPLRLVSDSNGQFHFVLDRKAICSKCKCRRRKSKK